MARRADWDNDDDFEIINKTSPIKIQEKLEFIEDDSFELVTCQNKPSSLINTNNPIQHVTIIDKPVPPPIKIEKPIVSEVKPSLENSSSLPMRYGSAAVIPYDEGFDLKSILTDKPNLPNQTNDLISILQDGKSKKQFLPAINLQQILIDNDQDRQNIVQIAKQAQEDFMNAIYLN